VPLNSVWSVHIIEADSIGDLIADCAQIPPSVRESPGVAPLPRLAPAWEVTDGCQAQVEGLALVTSDELVARYPGDVHKV